MMEGQPKQEEDQRSPSRLISVDRLKRDEWSEGAVECLLEAYESKWVLRNRAKLKGQDWEDVAREVSSLAPSSSSRPPKTATQCKNKIESMKKRYRNEVAAGSCGSRWPLFSRLDGLVRCRGSSASTTTTPAADSANIAAAPSVVLDDKKPPSQSAEPNGVAAAPHHAENHAQGEDGMQPTGADGVESDDQNAPSCDSSKEINHETTTKREKKRKRAKEEGWEVADNVRWLAEVMLRVEQSRMEAMREVEKIRAESEARKGEMDLKRTEIIANTQLQIAKLLARSADKINSFPRTGRD